MKLINQLVYSIASLFAIVTACSAFPISEKSMDNASELVIGLLALTCISVTILACTCCHRNKSGFELSQIIKDKKEFENENTIADQTNSTSEFPIFRAISPSNPGNAFSASGGDNNLDNRILSNIVNQNHMNRTFNEFENSQNNNGPISAVDMENIQNNNAADYIPNRNEINIVIDPSLHENNRNLVEVNRGSISMNATAVSTNIDLSVPMLMTEYERIANVSSFEPYYQMNELNGYHLVEPTAASESLNNYIDLTESNDQKCPEENELSHHNDIVSIVVAEAICHPAETEIQADDQISQPKCNDLELDLVDDDAISVEEALRALDFAISGGESIFSDSEYDSSSDESNNECGETHLPKQMEQLESKNSIELIETVDAKDIFSENEVKMGIEIHCNNSNIEHSRKYVYEFAKELVDSVLEECTGFFLSMTHSDDNVPKNESHAPLNGEVRMNNLDDSMEDMFVIGKLQASTPCHKININCQREKNRLGINLFQALDEVNESNLSQSGIEPLFESQTHIASATFETQPIEKQLASTFVKNDDHTFISAGSPEYLQETFNVEISTVKPQNDVPTISPTIKIDKDEVNSDDLTTITPMNTPIELNYVGTTWDQFVSKSMNKKCIDLEENTDEKQATIENATSTIDDPKNPWFLHLPQSNDTFNINDTEYSNRDGTDEDSESVEENAELLSLTFDALRKQLADVLPQASVRPSVDYSDDENESDSDLDYENLEYHKRFENPKCEVFINYKQQLSPILEESEDETCKTFVMNETKCLDSTSTGYIETSEAIMGVTKVLMASNDTLFNFEDTLGDREDMLSPRNVANSGSYIAISTTPRPENCQTPTNEGYLHAYPSEYKPNDSNVYSEIKLTNDIRPNTLQLNLENLTNNLNDLISPEQQKTISEEINTIELLSSDLSATIDATNTLDDLKTCISVHLNDDANNSKLENSEIDSHQTNSLTANESFENVEHVTCQQHQSDFLRKPPKITCQTIAEPHLNYKTSEHETGDVFPDLFTAQNAAENKNPNLDISKIYLEFKNPEQSELDLLNKPPGQLSGEEDPWAMNRTVENECHQRFQTDSKDLRFSGPCNDDVMQQISGTFATNDWDSDAEDSNSSEEFVYAKGTSQISEYLRATQKTIFPLDSNNQINMVANESIALMECSQESVDEKLNTQDIWNSHEDLIGVSTKADTDSVDDILDDISISENENEWVPSSWDSCAKPVRSALKSPDKSSSKTGAKSRRSVVFKKQSYQSVYEYPKENALSTALSEPQGWATYLANSSPFSSTMNGAYPDDDSNGSQIEVFNALDGFAVSSSFRPFHLSQFNAECHTWPTDSEFSWSQLQNDKGNGNGNDEVNYLADSRVWSTNADEQSESTNTDETRDLKSPSSVHRPDSGVGESADLSESLLLGELCHTKASLRLPLNVYTSNSLAKEKEMVQSTTPADDQNESSKSSSQNEYSSENVLASDSIQDSMDLIVPTSCTGSMDSINSFDGGKSSQIHLSNSTNTDGLPIHTTKVRNASNETSVQNELTINTNTSKKCDYRITANRQSDSTDEDSGIENIVRITKEI
ncbi:uncharacterized protein LOC129574238 isoform X2 [Sitodiplosis mosellana]|uniref:uncharacterized protein LOC129574238 isoform X2 n=1 Tax=Sitodiplosis mosellana TaxID=263140 RepID=UPI002443FF01|nr:uncharacterized protein LOC129574238 isoform X2 [Sitodiplosis mosellana]XP_055311914.1 uncharacterized protein LOC129574238 isoform X2 [Sitodiplosis mosellana]XP_055311915.1 uncharacterized protein LOC129574238 isoform X2 [Sitodiplosis mosellana]XP_055311916.1 uncharacterized protein LOC129574238 isoform X2 [Sitodiplosis mosellana]XP_055311917.1 uncharacterized protein LOC129574238 isoform X2 [Sitodiplosis mosellana]XP_055311919.1 uncharacterized protein LOC129574238 isoform X2 [Sitodiplosi